MSEEAARQGADTYRWYHRAARSGDPYAQFNLAQLYLRGDGVARDDAQAASWMTRAAESGLAYAQNHLGAMFHNSVDGVLDTLSTMGSTALTIVAGLLALFIAFKYAERRRHRSRSAVERIEMDELLALIDAGHEPVIIDARSLTAQQMQAAIPGAVVFRACQPEHLMASLDRDRHIVVYCSCPDDVTAAEVARQFMANGFHRARPLKGGLDAWNAQRGNDPELDPATC